MAVDIASNLVKLRKHLGLSQEKLATQLGIERSTYANYEKGTSKPGYDLLIMAAKLGNVTVDQLLSDNLEFKSSLSINEPFVNYDTTKGDAVPLSMADKAVMYVPLVAQYAYAGYESGFADNEFIGELPKVPWIVDKEYKGKYISFEVRGDSMDDGSRDSYIAGDILLCREIAPEYWINSKLHIRKWDFVIVDKIEGIRVKRITEHDVAKGSIVIHSLNDMYPDKEISLKDVVQIFNVVQVKRNK